MWEINSKIVISGMSNSERMKDTEHFQSIQGKKPTLGLNSWQAYEYTMTLSECFQKPSGNGISKTKIGTANLIRSGLISHVMLSTHQQPLIWKNMDSEVWIYEKCRFPEDLLDKTLLKINYDFDRLQADSA